MTTITRERLTSIVFGAKKHPGSFTKLEIKLAHIALASLTAEPVAYIFKHPAGKLFWALTDESNKDQADVMPVYAAPQPAPVVPVMYKGIELLTKDGLELIRDGVAEATGLETMCMAEALLSVQTDLVVPPKIEPDYEVITAILPTANPDEYACCIAADMWNACRAAMLQTGKFQVTPDEMTVERAYPKVQTSAGCDSTIKQPASKNDAAYGCQLVPKQTTLATKHALSRSDCSKIEWMWALASAPKPPMIGIDDITSALELLKQRLVECNRYNYCADAVDSLERATKAAMYQIESVADAPDTWIPVGERMPEKNQSVLISVNFDSDLVEPLICTARYTGSTFRRGDATIKPGSGIEQATHWMPLPEPPQEVKCGR